MSSEAVKAEREGAQAEAEQALTNWHAWRQRRVVLHELNRLGDVYDPYASWLSGEQALDEFYLEDQLCPARLDDLVRAALACIGASGTSRREPRN